MLYLIYNKLKKLNIILYILFNKYYEIMVMLESKIETLKYHIFYINISLISGDDVSTFEISYQIICDYFEPYLIEIDINNYYYYILQFIIENLYNKILSDINDSYKLICDDEIIANISLCGSIESEEIIKSRINTFFKYISHNHDTINLTIIKQKI